MELNNLKQSVIDELVKSKKIGQEDVIRATVQTRHLKVPMSQDEIIEEADALAQALSDVESMNNELESIKSQFKAKLKTYEAKIDSSRAKIRDKYGFCKIDCVEVMSNTLGIALEVRTDTGEIIDERNLTSDERQGRLFEKANAEAEAG